MKTTLVYRSRARRELSKEKKKENKENFPKHVLTIYITLQHSSLNTIVNGLFLCSSLTFVHDRECVLSNSAENEN